MDMQLLRRVHCMFIDEYFHQYLQYKNSSSSCSQGEYKNFRTCEILDTNDDTEQTKKELLDLFKNDTDSIDFNLRMIEDDYNLYYCNDYYRMGYWKSHEVYDYNVFKFDYEEIKHWIAPFAEELTAYVYNPYRLQCLAETYNMDVDELLELY